MKPTRGGASAFFADTNLFLYALDARDAKKRVRAAAWLAHLWREGSGRVSWQVLHEFYTNATRKFGVPPGLARGMVRELARWQPVETSLGLVESAWQWSDRAGVAYGDGLILAAAERCGAAYLLSEDFQVGRTYGGATVVNPFASSPEEFSSAN